MKIASYLILSSLMVLFGYLVFRVTVRREYERRDRLSALSTSLLFMRISPIPSFPQDGQLFHLFRTTNSIVQLGSASFLLA